LQNQNFDSAGAAAPAPAALAPEGWLVALRRAFRGEEHDYTAGSLNRAIVLLAIPMVIEMAMESVFAVTDVYFVSQLGPAAVATVGLTEAVMTLIYAIAFGLSMSTTALVARRIGEKNVAGAATAATQALALGIGVAALLGLPAALFADDILRLMKASEETVAIGSGYTRVLLGTNAVVLLLFLGNAVFRGAGDAVIAMKTLALANGINIVLDPCLIFGWGPFPELGLSGAAVATSIGRGTGVAYQLWTLRHGRGRVHLRGPAFRIDWKAMLNLLRISLGGIGQLLIATASWVVLMRIMAPFGEKAVAGYTIAIRILMFAILPAWGLANAAATLVGQNLGARQPERAERSVWVTGGYNMAFMVAVTGFFLLFSSHLIVLFEDDPEVVAFGSRALRVISYGYVLYAWGMVMTQAFNGAGDTVTPTWLNAICFWGIQIPSAWLLSRGLGPEGVYWSIVGAEGILALLLILVFRRGRWKLQRV
jgi:putative MATE family efflux protein